MKQQRFLSLTAAMLLVAVACFSGCNSGDVIVIETRTILPTEMHEEILEATQTSTDPIPVYAEEDIQAAKDVVTAKFDMEFVGCELLRLEYIPEKYPSDYEYYAKRCAVDRVIVLESDYTTGPDVSPSLNANHTYHNWKWILIDDGTGWSVWTCGYG